MPEPRVSVVIPTFRMEEPLRACLEHLARQTYRDFRVLVVDNDVSVDGELGESAERATSVPHSSPLEVARFGCAKAGSYHARSAGLARVRSELIAFTDADCRPTPGWLQAAVAAWDAAAKPGVVSGPIRLFPADEGPVSQYEMRHSYLAAVANVSDACVTANWLMSTRIYDELGGFDASLKSGADVDLAQRVRAAGYDLVQAPEMIVEHPTRTSLSDLLSKHRRTLGGAWSRTPGPLRTARLLRHVLRRGWTRYRRMRQEADPVSGMLEVQRAVTLAEIAETIRLARGGEPQR